MSPGRTAVLTIIAAAISVLWSPPAHADPDPHIPDPVHGHCVDTATPPEIYWTNSWFLVGVCDGQPYADGSYWHVQGFVAAVLSVYCAVGVPGSVGPPPAPPGGCEGRPAPVITLRRPGT